MIITPDSIIYEGEVQGLYCVSVCGGALGILAKHEPMIVSLADGPAHIIEAHGKVIFYDFSEAMVHVTPEAIVVHASVATLHQQKNAA